MIVSGMRGKVNKKNLSEIRYIWGSIIVISVGELGSYPVKKTMPQTFFRGWRLLDNLVLGAPFVNRYSSIFSLLARVPWVISRVPLNEVLIVKPILLVWLTEGTDWWIPDL
jgi:hypothetical protein